MSPLACITPHQDGELPQIVSIFFAVNNSGFFAVNSSGSNSHDWVPLNTVDPQGCTVVYGEVDIVAQIRDRDSAGSNHVGTKTLWVHNVRWRACPESNPNCPWNNTYLFDSMPTTWFSQGHNNASSAYFSVSKPWESEEDYCLETPLYAVVTNFVGGIPDKAGFWDTGKIPDGNYVVSVEATDFAGKTAVSSVNVCVRNNVPPSSPGNLRIQ
jgi:hypothetical protein